MLTFVHLSDLHIGQDGAEGIDRDRDPRNELIDDCKRVVAGLEGEVTGVLISGDIVNSGVADDFRRAGKWLLLLCQALDIPEENVWVVPGNHDFNREGRTKLWHKACERLRGCNVGEIDVHLRSYLDSQDRYVLLEPLRPYHEFAERFGCVPDGPIQIWEEEFELGNALQLWMVGLNTAMLADGGETENGDGLVIGENAVQLRRGGDEAFVIAMWHHPLNWLRDEEIARNYLNSRASVHLFGHEHTHCLSTDGGRLSVSAGALHPRREDQCWEPRYNLLQFSAAGVGVADGLEVSVIPRVWNDEQTSFASENGDLGIHRHDFKIGGEPAQAGDDVGEPHDEMPPVNARSESYQSLDDQPNGRVANRRRRLSLKYATLPFVRRIVIAGDLGLLDESDREVAGFEQTRLVLERAADKDRLEDLWAAVAAERDGEEMMVNPYSVTK